MSQPAAAIGNAGMITATAASGQIATATSLSGSSTASAQTTTNTGLDADKAITVDSGGTIRGTASSDNVATATSTDGGGTATASTTNNVGVDLEATLTIGSTGSLTGVANLNLAAAALTVGNSSTADVADANAGISSNNVALALDGSGGITTTIGSAGTVIGSATLTASASATGTKADALSDVSLSQATGIDLGAGATASSLVIGDAGTLTATSRVTTEAEAATTDGDASADTVVTRVAGFGDGSGIATIGNGGVINALASATNIATASATDADGSPVNANIDNNAVQGINLTSITAGSTLGLRADAISTQTATARNIGDPGGNDQIATAQVGANDSILGITTTIITAGSDVSQLTARATLTGDATASNVSGESFVRAGFGSTVQALDNGSTIQIGGDARNVAFQAVSNLTAEAVSVEDSSLASAGNSTVTGVDSSDVSIGGSLLNGGPAPGTLTASAASTLSATASTSGSQAGHSSAVYAWAAQDADGVLNSTISIGEAGNVAATATLVGTVAATNVGNNGDAEVVMADLWLDATGAAQAADTITIGATGNVTGQAFSSGSAAAQTTEGNASTDGNIDTLGLDLNAATADITIGKAGNISGLAVIGSLTKAGTLGGSVELTATTVDGVALSKGVFDGYGIVGTDGGSNASIGANQTLLTAGASDGDVSGQVLAGGSVDASSVGNSPAGADTATATINASTIAGLQEVDILGGQVGTNLVRGTSLGSFEATASSLYGDAAGSSTTRAYGIFDADNDGFITTSGNIAAIAQLSNTVIATSVHGNAATTAIADGNGLSGYTVTIIDIGALNASASTNARGLASSVHGSASS